jgi:hypothetical protein
MSDLEDEYYFIAKAPERPELPFLKPDEATVNLNFNFEAAPLGQAPFKFTNAWGDKRRQLGVRTIVPPVMFCGNDLVIEDKLRLRLVHHGDIPDLHIYPSVYVDDTGRQHENYWFLTFADRFDCWDRDRSEYDRDEPPVLLGGLEYHQVYKYKFNADVMKERPLEQRLLFKLGGTLDAYIVAHSSILTKFFGSPGVNGAEYIKVSDY